MPSRCLMPKAPGTGECDFDGHGVMSLGIRFQFSRIRWPTAVLDAGTW